ncbi:hypothetical protein C8J57DRAFT_1516530 [Mycena rebaudengoi]|nr:hypothetical protein C8J57DRAFT_1516530 [Mycena rebaudengoi]
MSRKWLPALPVRPCVALARLRPAGKHEQGVRGKARARRHARAGHAVRGVRHTCEVRAVRRRRGAAGGAGGHGSSAQTFRETARSRAELPVDDPLHPVLGPAHDDSTGSCRASVMNLTTSSGKMGRASDLWVAGPPRVLK